MKLTIEKFQQLYAISIQDLDDLEKSSRLVQCLTGKSSAEIDAMSIVKYNAICRKVTKVFDLKAMRMDIGKPKDLIRVNGRYYRLILSVHNPFNAGKYVEIATFSNDVIGNLHKIMASIAIPMKWSWKKMGFVPIKSKHEDIANNFLDADFSAAYHAAVFFYAVLKNSIQAMKPYLITEMMDKGLTMQEAKTALMASLEVLDGFTQPKWLRTLKIAV